MTDDAARRLAKALPEIRLDHPAIRLVNEEQAIACWTQGYEPLIFHDAHGADLAEVTDALPVHDQVFDVNRSPDQLPSADEAAQLRNAR